MNYAAYFFVLTIGWAAIWSAGVWFFHTRQAHGPVLRRLTRKQRVLLACAAAAVPCVYCLSYAPFLRILTTHSEWRLTIAALDDLYVPVHWLSDQTLLRRPLLWWADFCQVPAEFLTRASVARTQSSWGDDSTVVLCVGLDFVWIGVLCGSAVPCPPTASLRSVDAESSKN